MSASKLTLIVLAMLLISKFSIAQTDSSLAKLQQLPNKYFAQVAKKIDKYSNRLTSKTEKTLTKLAHWETRLQKTLRKVSPETAQRLFANPDMTFSGMLKKLQEEKSIVSATTAQYNEYRDQLSTGLKYIEQQKQLLDSNVIKPAMNASKKMKQLEDDVAQTEVVDKFIIERKRQLVSESFKYIGKSKYLSKINKESYYYSETLKNYKEVFSDTKKAEELAKKILNNVPAFKKFAEKNSMLASLFGSDDSYGTVASLVGLQTRASVNSLIQERIAAGGPNAQAMFQQNMQAAQAELNSLKDKLLKGFPSNGEGELPDFKPNTQRSKTFAQRIEYNANIQFAKSNFLPSTADIGLGAGYKFNDKGIIGLGISYKLGMGSIQRISFTNQGIGLRTYIDWKWKKNLYLSGGYELNHNTGFKKIAELRDPQAWQQSGLIGLMKKLPMKTKMVKNTQLKLLYDFLYRSHIPVSQPILFRIGYIF